MPPDAEMFAMTAQDTIEKLRVDLAERSYDILIGPGLIARAGAEIAPLLRRQAGGDRY